MHLLFYLVFKFQCLIFKYLELYEKFVIEIESFISGTKERISTYTELGIEDDKLFFEQTLRSKKGLVVSTAHGIKGEEYKIVFCFGLLEGYIPHFSEIFSTENEDEEEEVRDNAKRLLFVISSRAKEKLFLYAENDKKTRRGAPYLVNEDVLEVYELLVKKK